MTEKEPTFSLQIRECQFNRLNQESLWKKLKLMREIGLVKYYTIVEDTETIYADTKNDPKTEPKK